MADARLQKRYDREGRNTSSTDPKLMNSRVFIGNLAADKMSRQDVEKLFAGHGKILGVSLHKSYGFVQFSNETDAKSAVNAMHGQMVQGLRLDVNIATERRKEPMKEKPREMSQRRDRDRDKDRARRHRSRSPPMRLPSELEYEARLRHMERLGYGSPYPGFRNPPRDPYMDPLYGMRDPYTRPPPPRDDLYDRYRERPPPPRDFPYPPRESYGSMREPPYYDRDPYDRHAPIPPSREAFEGGLSAGRPARRPSPPPSNEEKKPVDMEIIVVNRQQKEYGDYVRSRIQSMGLKVETAYLSPTVSLADALDNAAQRGLLYAMIITSQHEVHRSTTLTILHGRNPQEHKNMPLDDALGLIDRDYERYCLNIREGRVPPRRGGGANSDVTSLLNKAASGEKLSSSQLEAVIHELQKQKQQSGVGASMASKEDIQRQQADLQAKILSLLGSNAVVPSSSNSPASQNSSFKSVGDTGFQGPYDSGYRRDTGPGGGIFSGGYGGYGYQ